MYVIEYLIETVFYILLTKWELQADRKTASATNLRQKHIRN